MIRGFLLALAAIAIASCVKWERDPLAVYQADPAALQIPVTTFAVIPF